MELASQLTAPLRGTLLLAVVVLVGGPPTAELVVYPLADAEDVRTTVVDRLVLLLVGVPALTAFAAATALLLATSSGGLPLSADGGRALLATEWGPVWVAQTAVTLGLGLVALVGIVGFVVVPRQWWLRGATAGGVLVLLAVCASGYSTVVPDARVAIALKFGHMAGAAVWTGGLVALTTVCPPVLRAVDEDARRRAVARAIRSFSPIAVGGVTLASVAGLLIAVWHLPGATTVRASDYGVVLAVKVAFALAAAGLGGVNRFLLLSRLQPAACRRRTAGRRLLSRLPHGGAANATGRGATQSFVWAIRVEVLVLVAVMLLSVVLTAVLSVPAGAGHLNATGSEFRSVLLVGAMVVAAVGFTTFGYEVTEVRREPPPT